MPHLSPPTLTVSEQKAILRVTAKHPRDHVIYSLALGTGLRLSEIVGLNVADMFFPDGTPRTRVRIRAEIAKGGRAGEVFLPDKLRRQAPKVVGLQAQMGDSSRRPAALQPVPEEISNRRVQCSF